MPQKVWTAHEDKLIEEFVKRSGTQWRFLKYEKLQYRSEASIRNRFHRMQVGRRLAGLGAFRYGNSRVNLCRRCQKPRRGHTCLPTEEEREERALSSYVSPSSVDPAFHARILVVLSAHESPIAREADGMLVRPAETPARGTPTLDGHVVASSFTHRLLERVRREAQEGDAGGDAHDAEQLLRYIETLCGR